MSRGANKDTGGLDVARRCATSPRASYIFQEAWHGVDRATISERFGCSLRSAKLMRGSNSYGEERLEHVTNLYARQRHRAMEYPARGNIIYLSEVSGRHAGRSVFDIRANIPYDQKNGRAKGASLYIHGRGKTHLMSR